jgi:hypothetical protein
MFYLKLQFLSSVDVEYQYHLVVPSYDAICDPLHTPFIAKINGLYHDTVQRARSSFTISSSVFSGGCEGTPSPSRAYRRLCGRCSYVG